MTNTHLYTGAYEHFRHYLDHVYSHKGENNVYGLSVGYPTSGQFELPSEILQHLVPFENGHEKPRPGYGWEAGSQPVREAILAYENQAHGTTYNLKNICIVAGATYGLSRVLEYLFTDSKLKSSRDELLVISPTFYRMLGRAESYARVTSVEAKESNNFQITIEEVLQALSPKTKAVFLLNPSNPTYLYYKNDFLEQLVNALSKRGIYLVIDESGDAYVADENSNHSYHKMTPALQNRYVVRIVTASKKYLLAEYRIGYVLAGEEFIGTKSHGFIKLIGDDMSNPPLAANDAWLSLLQHELLSLQHKACLNTGCDFGSKFKQATEKMLRLRNQTIAALQDMKHIRKIITPDANYNLIFALETQKPYTDIDVFDHMLNKYDLALVPGSGFGIAEKLFYFRLTFAIREEELTNGLAALKAFTESDFL